MTGQQVVATFSFKAVLRIRDVYPGSDFFPSRIPDPNCSHPGSRIRIKEFKYFKPKKWFLSSRKYDPGCSSRIPDPDPDFLPIPDPGSRIPDPGVKKLCNFSSFRWRCFLEPNPHCPCLPISKSNNCCFYRLSEVRLRGSGGRTMLVAITKNLQLRSHVYWGLYRVYGIS